MWSLILIAKSNMKKKKNDLLVVFLLVILSFLLLYVGSSVLLNLGKVQDKTNETMNGADFLLFTSSECHEEILSVLSDHKTVKKSSIEYEDCLYLSALRYFPEGADQKDASEMDFLMEDISLERSLSKLVITDAGEELKENSIILPYYLKAESGYRTGDIINLMQGEDIVSFEVYGFAEDVLFATPTNVSTYKCFITNTYMRKLEGFNNVLQGRLYRMDVQEGESPSEFEGRIYALLEDEIPDWQQESNMSFNYESLKGGAVMNARILLVVVIIFASLLLVVAMVVIRFSIQNGMEMNQKNIGMLQASGYTGKQLGKVTIFEIMSVSVCGIMSGMLMAGKIMSIVGNLIATSIGQRWNQGFDLSGAVLCMLIVLILIFATAWIASAKYQKIMPLEALREGIHTHNFKKNSIPLRKTVLPLHMTLGLKYIFQEKKNSITVCFIALLLSFVCNVGAALYENFVETPDFLLHISGIEVPTTIIGLDGKIDASYEEIGNTLSALKETEDVLYMNRSRVIMRNGEKQVINLCDFYSQPEKLRTNTVVEGRWPVYDNEILLSGPLADSLDAEIGDVIYLEMSENSEAYLLCGISQHISNYGRKGILTMEGARRLNDSIRPAFINCYAKEGVTYEELEKVYQKVYPGLNMSDAWANTMVSMASISAAMEAVCVLFFLVTVVVIVMIIYLLAKTRLIRERKQMGIYKAVGYTTFQLIRQIVTGYVPVIGAGSVLGAVAAYFLMNPLIVLCLSMVGFKKCDMNMNLLYMAAAVAAMTLLAGWVAFVCALRIRKVEPYKIISSE